MAEKNHILPADIRGISRLAVDATLGLTDLVEAMHHTIANTPWILGAWTPKPATGITGFVYSRIRVVTQLVGDGSDLLWAQLLPLLGEPGSSPERERMLAVLNGVLGDHLAASDNPLATSMQLRQNGAPLPFTGQGVVNLNGKILLLVHGLCLNDLQWQRKGHDHGVQLAADLGYTPVYLYYNSGLHISTNGRMFADQLEELVHHWPVPVQEIVIVGHSMGGLVSRSACHYGAAADHEWLRYLTKMVFLGTPHHGAPLERHGNGLHGLLGITPYTAVLANLGKIRSAGITDLRYGNLLDEDWAEHDRFAPVGDQRRPVPLPPHVHCYTMAATTGQSVGDRRDQLLGDGLVPLSSALGHHPNPLLAISFPAEQQWIGCGMSHVDLLHQPELYAKLRHWLAD
jgi:pimeloyl-ACP methyl ester carboxylesterase